ncbi:D-Ala-D-Ala carboxypeptidase family metallohydrolase, partial [Enterobacter hormaechei]
MLNQYFKRSEFACRCGCGTSTVDAELLQVITDVREKFGPVVINSGHRCVKHNAA